MLENPIEIAKNFIRVQVERGDTLEDLINSQMGGGDINYHCDINPNHIINGKRVKRDSLVISRINGKSVEIVIPLSKVFNLLKAKQMQLF